MPVKVAMIVFSKLRLRTELAGQQATCQRYSCQDAHTMLTCSSKKLFRRLETKHVEDDLHALNVRIGNRFERPVHTLQSPTITADFTPPHQPLQHAHSLRHIIPLTPTPLRITASKRSGLQVAQAA